MTSAPMIWQVTKPYIELTRLNKPIGIFLLLWPTYWALWVASSGMPDPKLFVIFTLGTILMRSAGCVINDYADRHIDPHVERTKLRPLASNRLSPSQALTLFFALLLCAFLLVLQTNLQTIGMSFIALFLAILYPFTKRFFRAPQVFLGAAFAWSVPMAFTAQGAPLSMSTWLMFFVTLLWTVSYDTQYAMVDRDDDTAIGIGSTAILFGRQDRLAIALLQIICLFALVLLGKTLELGLTYYLGLCVALLNFGYQHWLIKDREREACFKAFLQNSWVGFAIFLGLVTSF